MQMFVTPENYLERRSEELESTEGKLLIAGLDSGKALADSIVELSHNVRGSDVFLIQALHDPVAGTPVDQKTTGDIREIQNQLEQIFIDYHESAATSLPTLRC